MNRSKQQRQQTGRKIYPVHRQDALLLTSRASFLLPDQIEDVSQTVAMIKIQLTHEDCRFILTAIYSQSLVPSS